MALISSGEASDKYWHKRTRSLADFGPALAGVLYTRDNSELALESSSTVLYPKLSFPSRIRKPEKPALSEF